MPARDAARDKADPIDAVGPVEDDGVDESDARVQPGEVGDAHAADVREAAARSTRRTLLLAAVVAAVVLVAIVGVALSRTPSVGGAGGVAADTPPLLSQDGSGELQPLPAVALPPLGRFGPAGGVDLSEADGQPLVINFWASWCAPCVEEMPMLQRVAEDLGIRMVGVDYIDQADKATALARELDIRYTLVRDDDGSFGQAVGLLGTPTTLLVDGDGVVRRRLTGALTEEQLRTAIADDLERG